MDTTESRRAYRHWGSLTAGIIVIAVGVIFLLHNLGVALPFTEYHNWWALFIFVGAAGPLGYAVQRFRSVGKVDGPVLHSLFSAAGPILVALFFLLELPWDQWWPLFMIYGGLWMLAKHFYRKCGAE